jgi:outer membrane lipoprotein-sorting protein
MKFTLEEYMKKNFFLILAFVIIFTGISAFSEDAINLIRRLDNNEVYNSIKYDGEMIIYISGKKYEKTFSSYSKGSRNFFAEFTNSDDAGTKYLKKDGNLFVYTPDLENVVPITGHMLRESMMGSDLSYEDTVNNDTLESQYDGKIISESKFDGDTKFKRKDIWVLELTAKNKTVSYAKRVVWIDKETFAALRYEYYALSGAKLKEYLLLDAKWIGNRYFAVESQFRDLNRENSKTIFKMNKIELDINIPDIIFSLKNLTK